MSKGLKKKKAGIMMLQTAQVENKVIGEEELYMGLEMSPAEISRRYN